MTDSMRTRDRRDRPPPHASRRRTTREHGITPQTIRQGDRRARWWPPCEARLRRPSPVAERRRRPTRRAIRRRSPRRIAALRGEMREAARQLEFERAAELRDRVRALETRLHGAPLADERAGLTRQRVPTGSVRRRARPCRPRSRPVSPGSADVGDVTRRRPRRAIDVTTRPSLPAQRARLEERLATVPPRPGVYLLKDAHGKVIYVGKAKSLRSRVRTYFRGGDERSQVRFLVQRVADFETLVTANEKEALILENNLIKQYKPRYNIRLKDDKSYVSVKVTVQDAVAARAGHAQDRQGRQPLLRSVPSARQRARDARHDPQGLPAAHLQRRRVPQPRAAVPRVPDQALPRRRAACRSTARSTSEHLREAMLLLEGTRPRARRQLRRAHGSARPTRERFEEAARLRDQIARHREDAGAPAGGRALGRRPGRLRPLPRGRLHRGAGAVRARRAS